MYIMRFVGYQFEDTFAVLNLLMKQLDNLILSYYMFIWIEKYVTLFFVSCRE